MSRVFSYLLDMFPYMLLAIPFIVIVRMLILLIRKEKINWQHEILLLILILFLVGLFAEAFIPDDGRHITNFIPFKILFDTYDQVFNKNNINYLIISFLGNIIMFIPIGFLIKKIWDFSDKKVILIGASISLFIELTQLFLNRTTDIDDLILNTLGIFLGIVLNNYCNKIKKESRH